MVLPEFTGTAVTSIRSVAMPQSFVRCGIVTWRFTVSPGATGTFGNMSTTFTYGDDRLVTVERRDPQRILFVLQIQYDDQGRPREVLTRQPSDSNPEAVVDFQRRAFTYGSDGRLERHATEGVSKTTFEYDAQGRMTEEVKHYERSEDPPSRTKYTYDPSGRLGSIGTEHQTWTYHYAPSGQRDRMTMTNSAGRVLYEQSMEYDASGRLVARRVTAGRGDAEKVEYEGTFGAGAVCGELHTVPQGIPAEYGWLGISP